MQVQVAEAAVTPGFATMNTMKIGQDGSTSICNLDLHGEAERAEQLQQYYDLCRQATGLHVTTSCFTTWRQNKKTNAYGKVIPTARIAGQSLPCRVFFFDDNLELEGSASSSGICSLRDVDCGEGSNGFQCAHTGRHTLVLHSSEWNSVLVKANILDAIEDQDYFTNIIRAYSYPG